MPPYYSDPYKSYGTYSQPYAAYPKKVPGSRKYTIYQVHGSGANQMLTVSANDAAHALTVWKETGKYTKPVSGKTYLVIPVNENHTPVNPNGKPVFFKWEAVPAPTHQAVVVNFDGNTRS